MPGLTFVPVQPAVPAAPAERGHGERDPHVLPTFTNASVRDPTVPVLYLPPLLSALPRSIPDIQERPATKGNHDYYNQYYGRVLPTVMPLPKLPPHPDRLHPTATRLPDIDPASLSLHRALHFLKPKEGFAKLPYTEVFNWDGIGNAYHSDESVGAEGEVEREWYVVAFRSRRKPGSDGAALYEADRLAHEEAVQNGGLIMYWYGVPDPETGDNLATCIWQVGSSSSLSVHTPDVCFIPQSRAHAVAANSRPHHIKAMRLAAASFEYYTLERHVLRKWRGKPGLEVVPYTGGEVGW
ncbi:hypothetical protein FRC10_002182 [Ceratobasidium sp. 414]|nr:hypothetical protein FRC10_002182 [Ceratobasidium sp. 414]